MKMSEQIYKNLQNIQRHAKQEGFVVHSCCRK